MICCVEFSFVKDHKRTWEGDICLTQHTGFNSTGRCVCFVHLCQTEYHLEGFFGGKLVYLRQEAGCLF